ncbi:MAG: nucleotidyl transferase AbiEii/AbiGii toxin family protein [Chitinophagaceae bacterium]|nr:nucleotidyl transferase AbiEii/AbiGii toxin family protein [Chitinophagaceae bacterium]
MLRTQTVEKGTLDLIKKLMSDNKLNKFTLVGGTALALKIGHRTSIDIDLFTVGIFNASDLAAHLSTSYHAVEVRTLTNGVFCFIDDIKVDLISHQYPSVDKVDTEEGIRMASLLDIGAMKLNAIYNNGTRLKDFVDMYYLLEVFALEELLRACHKKYPDINLRMVRTSLTHFADIDFSPPIHYFGREPKWAEIAERLTKASQNMYVKFDIPKIARELLARKPAKGKTKGRRL